MDFNQFDQWIRRLDSEKLIKNIEVVDTGANYQKYILTLLDNKILECEAGENVDVYFARFDGYYFYADNGYTPEVRRTLLNEFRTAIDAIVRSNYHEKFHYYKNRLLKRELFFDGAAEKVNKFAPHKVGFVNRLMQFLPGKIEVVKPRDKRQI